MTPKEAFETLKARINVVEPFIACPPSRKAVDDRVFEGHRLFAEASKDKKDFESIARAGHFDIDNLNLLQMAALALDYAESECLKKIKTVSARNTPRKSSADLSYVQSF